MQHDSIKLLLDSLERETKKRLSPSELARALNVSEQVITNWSKRGISLEGALAAQFAFQRDANFILGRLPNPIMFPRSIYSAASETKPLLAIEPSIAPTSPLTWPFKKVTSSQWSALDTSSRELVETMIQKLTPA
jgi:hypothetical protein